MCAHYPLYVISSRLITKRPSRQSRMKLLYLTWSLSSDALAHRSRQRTRLIAVRSSTCLRSIITLWARVKNPYIQLKKPPVYVMKRATMSASGVRILCRNPPDLLSRK